MKNASKIPTSDGAGSSSEQAATSGMRKWLVVFVLSMAVFILVLDTTMMNVSISALCHDLNTNVSAIQGAITLYTLVMAAFMITGATLGQKYGMKKVFRIAMVMYGIGTCTAAMAPSVTILILGWSLVEGLAAALLTPITFSLIIENYSGRDGAIGLSILSGVAATGAAIGPIFGGFMTTYLSWRYAFGVEVLIVIMVLLLSGKIRSRAAARGIRLDILGVALSALGLALSVLAVTKGGVWGWWHPLTGTSLWGLSPVPYAMALGVVMLALFIVWENHLAKSRSVTPPLIHPFIFTERSLSAGLMVVICLSVGMVAPMFIIPIFVQNLFHYSAIRTGFLILPLSLMILFCSFITNRLCEKWTVRKVLFGGMGLGLLGNILLYMAIQVDFHASYVVGAFLVAGSGVGLVLPMVSNIMLNVDVTKGHSPDEASGICSTGKQLGSSFATAISGTVLSLALLSALAANITDCVLQDQPELQRETVYTHIMHMKVPQVLEKLQAAPEEKAQQVHSIIYQSATQATRVALLAPVLGLFLALGSAFFLPRKLACRN